MIELFTLDRVNKSPASFDPQKLWAFEDRHMRGVPVESKVPAAPLYLQRAGLVPAPPPSAIGPYIARVIAAAGDRIKTMGDILQFREFFVADDALPRRGAEFEKLMKRRHGWRRAANAGQFAAARRGWRSATNAEDRGRPAPRRCFARLAARFGVRRRVRGRPRSSRSSRRSSPSATSRSGRSFTAAFRR